MQAVLIQEDIFNQDYRASGRVADFNNLLKFASINGYLPEQQVEYIFSVFKESITNSVLMDLVYDEEDDINLLLEELVTFCYDSLNDFLVSMDNPYKAIKCILDMEPNKFIVVAREKYKSHQEETQQKVIELIKKSQLILENNNEFKSLIDYLREKIINKNASYPLYRLMNDVDFVSINCLDELDLLIENVSIEVDIINRFNISEVIRMLKSFTIVDVSKNVTETALYNYVYNSFYKDGSSIDFTSNMCSIITRDIKMGMFDVEDVIEIITTGKVEFSELEKKYILEYFVNTFKREVIENAHVDGFKKTRKNS